jgi:histone H3/H4
MSKSNENDLYGTNLSVESMKVIAESIGIGNLPDDAAKELAEDISFKLKHIIQDAAKFVHHAKRTKLMQNDIDAALRAKNLEVQLHDKTVNNLIYFFFSPSTVFSHQNRFRFDSPLEVEESSILLKKKKLF